MRLPCGPEGRSFASGRRPPTESSGQVWTWRPIPSVGQTDTPLCRQEVVPPRFRGDTLAKLAFSGGGVREHSPLDVQADSDQHMGAAGRATPKMWDNRGSHRLGQGTLRPGAQLTSTSHPQRPDRVLTRESRGSTCLRHRRRHCQRARINFRTQGARTSRRGSHRAVRQERAPGGPPLHP